ncbi:MAG: tetrahydrofolate synthase [Chlamydiae bacterium CG10_big_fil_rev_8_21_14_0_10_35_9]|nr:MAG: tetrahydrofolate synthase [Chlamydiae bacterium CG10_big_fil_rev_8_21_14_0_10_35_9]
MNAQIYKLYQLASLSRTSKLSLDNIQALYHKLHAPAKNIPIIHVAGTNGKGSVSSKIAKALSLSSLKCGLFTSPHISSFRERIQINGQMIEEKYLEGQLKHLFSFIEENHLEIHFFELLVILALQYFEDQKVDVIVMEVGLGGRLDATNIISPILSIITSIGFDHTHILGDTLEKIAQEKAGIIKQGIPLVLGPKSTYFPILDRAKDLGAAIYQVSGHFSYYDEENSAIAKQALQNLSSRFVIPANALQEGLSIRPPCRMEVIKKGKQTVILDVAHNPEGIGELKKALEKRFPLQKFEILLGMSKDKDIEKFCEKLLSIADRVHLVRFYHPRLEVPETIAKYLQNKIPLDIHDSFEEVLESFPSHLLVCGSFFIMEPVRKLLGLSDVSDEVNLNEYFLPRS